MIEVKKSGKSRVGGNVHAANSGDASLNLNVSALPVDTSLRGVKVLVMESDPQLAKTLELILGRKQATTTYIDAADWSFNKKAALSKVKKFNPNIIIANPSSYEALTELQEDSSLKFEIVGMSGSAHKPVIQAAFKKLKAHCVLEKPFGMDDLISQIVAISAKK